MRRSSGGLPAWWPSRVYYGWALVGVLGLTATVSYGVLLYSFAAFLAPMHAELGWTKTQITGAFSVSQLVSGFAAIPVGRWVDRHGARALMTAGSVLAALLLVVWSRVHALPAFYALWALLGLVSAAVWYEPAFVVLATWFRTGRSRALTVLTFMGGFASVLFVPLATTLIARQGWRAALVTLAGLYAALTVLPHALVLRYRPADLGLAPDGAPYNGASAGGARPDDVPPDSGIPNGVVADDEAAARTAVRRVVRGRTFRWVTLAFTLSGLATTAVSVHLIPLLIERGYGAAFAGGAVGVLGLMALPGRLVFTPLGARWPRAAVTAAIFGLQAAAVLALLATRSAAGVWAFVGLFGAGFGAITPSRAALVGDLVPPTIYGRVSGVLALVVALARAAAPVGASLLYTAGGGVRHGYDAVLVAVLLLCVASGAAVLLSDRAPTRDPVLELGSGPAPMGEAPRAVAPDAMTA